MIFLKQIVKQLVLFWELEAFVLQAGSFGLYKSWSVFFIVSKFLFDQ